MNAKQLLRRLQQLGAVVEPSRGKGGHQLVEFHGRITFVPVHGRELPKGTFHKILKDLGLKKTQIRG